MLWSTFIPFMHLRTPLSLLLSNQPIGVSDYQISKAIPEALKSSLPDISDLENELLKQEDRLRFEMDKADDQH